MRGHSSRLPPTQAVPSWHHALHAASGMRTEWLAAASGEPSRMDFSASSPTPSCDLALLSHRNASQGSRPKYTASTNAIRAVLVSELPLSGAKYIAESKSLLASLTDPASQSLKTPNPVIDALFYTEIHSFMFPSHKVFTSFSCGPSLVPWVFDAE